MWADRWAVVKFKVGQKAETPADKQDQGERRSLRSWGCLRQASLRPQGWGHGARAERTFPGLEGTGASCPMDQEE